MKIVDLSFGINHQAMAVLHYLDSFNLDCKDGDIWTTTAPWYNGRERGIVIEFRRTKSFAESLCIAFFEHRNSDKICALKWIGNPGINPPCLLDSASLAYPTDNKFNDIVFSVGTGEAGKMADWILEQVEDYCQILEENK